MTADKIISVNPAKATLGSLHPEMTEGFLRQRNHIAVESSANQRLARFMTGQSASKYNSVRCLLLRVAAAVAICISVFSMSASNAVPSSLTLILVSFLAVGLLTVPAALVLLLVSVEGIFASFGGASVGTPLLLAFCALAVAIFGPGKLSVDNLLFRMLRHRYHERHRRANTEEISYRAFRNMQNRR